MGNTDLYFPICPQIGLSKPYDRPLKQHRDNILCRCSLVEISCLEEVKEQLSVSRVHYGLFPSVFQLSSLSV